MGSEQTDHDSRTIFCANLVPDKVTEELLYELFLQVGPIERVSIPKDKDGNGRGFGFITFKHQTSVQYALSVYTGTRLFNRELRIDNRSGNGNRNNNSGFNRQQIEQSKTFPNTRQHQYQIHNPFSNATSALSNPFASAAANPMNIMPKQQNQPNFSPNQQIDYQQLLAFSTQMLTSANGSGQNNIGMNNEMHNSQSKMMRRHERRPHEQSSKSYFRDREDRERDRKERTRDRSPRSNWIRNKDHRDNRDRNSRGNDSHSRRNDNRR